MRLIIDLSITWVDGKAEWGIFTLVAGKLDGEKKWYAYVHSGGDDHWCKEQFKSQKLAQIACVNALKQIVTRGK